ncbi:MAG TPA: hypothetical protein DCW37_02180 [Cellvibrionales bacterium]|jgi:HemY protein|nr:hypothetical protein [Cellvibrionales bacterium]HCX26840.1 hypothetical protein [Cellvibrionales bacterium]
MRRLFVFVLIVLAISAVLFSMLENGSGYVLIVVGDTTIEMAFIVAAAINVLAFVVLYFLVVILRMLFSTRRGVLAWAKNHRRQRGLNRTTQGLIAFVEGRWDVARKTLAKSADNSSTPLINYLFAARASSAVGDAKAVDNFLKKAELSTQGADVAISLTQAELQIQNGQYEQALATLLRAKKIASHHPVVLAALMKVYRQLNDWDSLLNLLPSLKKYNALSAIDVKNLEREACSAKLMRAVASHNINGLLSCWKSLPSSVKQDALLVACYAEQLIVGKQYEQAERLLRSQLQREYNEPLVKLYGLAVAEPLAKQLAFAEQLLKSHSESATLRLTLARICLNHGLDKKARQYLEGSLDLELVAGIFSELAGIYASQGDYKKSVECYKRELPERGSDSAALCKADLSTTSPLVKEKSLFTSADDIQQPLRR